MSGYENTDPMVIAKQAERDLNSQGAKRGLERVDDTSRGANGASDSTLESGVDQSVEHKFPGAEVKIGGQGASDNRQIPLSEGGSINPQTGKQTKAADFQGTGGPEDKAAQAVEQRPGDDDIRSNIRQGAETVRPAGSISQNAAGGTGKSTQ